jgi:hypothetical protein
VNTAPASTQSSFPLEVAGNVVEPVPPGIWYSEHTSVVHALVNPFNPAVIEFPPCVVDEPIRSVAVPYAVDGVVIEALQAPPVVQLPVFVDVKGLPPQLPLNSANSIE